MTINMPSINDIKDAFPYQAIDFKLDKECPSKTEIQDMTRKIEENCLSVACVEFECFDFGWAVLFCKTTDWNNFHVE